MNTFTIDTELPIEVEHHYHPTNGLNKSPVSSEIEVTDMKVYGVSLPLELREKIMEKHGSEIIADIITIIQDMIEEDKFKTP